MEEIKCKNGKALPLQRLSSYYSAPINLSKDERISGLYAWAGILLFVLLYDTYAIKTNKIETLTRAFWRLTDRPIKSVAPVVAWSALTAHLLFEKNIRKKKFGTAT